MISKKKAEHRHAAKRFLERAMIDFSPRLNDIFCKCIRARENVKFIRKQSNRVTVWDISYEDKIYRCVYDKIRKQIVTLLSVTLKSVIDKPILKDTPRKDGILKYGVLWASEEKLKRHEERLKDKYDEQFKPVEGTLA